MKTILVAAFFACIATFAEPDLRMNPNAQNTDGGVEIKNEKFKAGGCFASEVNWQGGTSISGTHRIMRFNVGIYNGNPSRKTDAEYMAALSPWIVENLDYEHCFAINYRWYLEHGMRYELRTLGGATVAWTELPIWCIRDDYSIPGWFPEEMMHGGDWDCVSQGLDPGWRSWQYKGLNNGSEGQFLVITGIPSGTYNVVEIVDPYNFVTELDETNNTYTWSVVIP